MNGNSNFLFFFVSVFVFCFFVFFPADVPEPPKDVKVISRGSREVMCHPELHSGNQ